MLLLPLSGRVGTVLCDAHDDSGMRLKGGSLSLQSM